MMKKSKIASRVNNIPPSGIREFFDIAAQMDNVISLGVGEPGHSTPRHIREAGVKSLKQGYTMYTSNSGLFELREEISNYYSKNYDLRYNPENEVLITVGVSEAIDIALRTVIEPGDEVLIPEPCFVSYKPCTLLAGGTPVSIPTTAEQGFKVKPQDLVSNITPKTKALLISYPCNPTGISYSYTELQEITRIIKEYDLIVISDETYSEIIYGNFKHYPLCSFPGMRENTITLNGFSKSFAMTGWRIGFALGVEKIISPMSKIHQYAIMCAPTMGQVAALEALKNGISSKDKMVTGYEKRKNLMVKGLKDIGLPCIDPQGAFYVFPSIKNTKMSSKDFAQALLQEEKVAVIPGNAFGECGEGHIRCSYASSVKNLMEGLKRIQHFVNKIIPKVS